MSKVINNNFTPGAVISRTDANAKFTDIQTATGSINEENVRSEGVDRRTLATHAYSSGRMEPLVYMDYFSNGVASSPGAYNNQDGTAAFPLLNGSPTELDWTSVTGGGVTMTAGDLLRIHFTVFFTKHDDPGFEPAGPASSDPYNQSQSVGLVFFPVWDIGSGYSQITNQVDLTNTVTAPYSFTIDGSTNRTDGLAWVSLEGVSSGGFMFTNRQVHGMLCYKHTGADIKIEKLKIYGRGPVVYEKIGANRAIHVPQWGIDLYANTCLDIPTTGATEFDIYIAAYQMSATILRGTS